MRKNRVPLDMSQVTLPAVRRGPELVVPQIPSGATWAPGFLS